MPFYLTSITYYFVSLHLVGDKKTLPKKGNELYKNFYAYLF